MNSLKVRILALTLVSLSCPALFAQRGCFHSPEAPTGILLLVGGAGMAFGSRLLGKWAARRGDKR